MNEELKNILSRVDHTLLAQGATWNEIKAICDDGIKYGCASVCIPASYVKQAAAYVDGKIAGHENGLGEIALVGVIVGSRHSGSSLYLLFHGLHGLDDTAGAQTVRAQGDEILGVVQIRDAAGRNMRFAKMGVMAVEMEAAGLYCTAAYTGKRALAICSISDNLVNGTELSADERQSTFTNMMKIALEVAVKMAAKK